MEVWGCGRKEKVLCFVMEWVFFYLLMGRRQRKRKRIKGREKERGEGVKRRVCKVEVVET